MSFFTGTPGMFKRMEGVPSDAFSTASNYYKGLLNDDSKDFDAMAAPELRRFNQQTVPDLAEQFAGMGSGGAVGGSGFRNAAVGAGADLSERLGELRARLRQNAAQGLTDIGSQGTYFEEGRPGLVDFAGPAIGAAATAFGGPAAGALGSLAGNWLSSRFGQKNQSNQLAKGPAGLYPSQGNYNPNNDESSTFR